MKTHIKISSSLLLILASIFQPFNFTVYAAPDEQTTDVQSLDGIGNNIAHPKWGGVNEQYLRFSPADYADGIASPSGENRPTRAC